MMESGLGKGGQTTLAGEEGMGIRAWERGWWSQGSVAALLPGAQVSPLLAEHCLIFSPTTCTCMEMKKVPFFFLFFILNKLEN